MNKTFFLILLSSIFAMSTAWSEQSTEVDETHIIHKDDFIAKLKPKIVTRGIRINQPMQRDSQPTQTVQVIGQEAPPSVSMAINFEFNSAELTEQSRVQLSQLGQALQSAELSELPFMLEGHTDAIGSDNFNLLLSQKRTQVVGQFLYDNFGADPNLLHLVGQGETNLLDKENPSSAVNRRVTITTMQN